MTLCVGLYGIIGCEEFGRKLYHRPSVLPASNTEKVLEESDPENDSALNLELKLRDKLKQFIEIEWRKKTVQITDKLIMDIRSLQSRRQRIV